ncbi:MAG: TetR/AcrR family transcriptional regulator [Gammaproteobacteria bacterium]|nr:TetR/AcrR family transcriptional regulator [Gammaproteobacteria bacterium]
MAKRSDKRERLINAAKELFYKQGFSSTTIADIAKLADVPLGNVYYYFKTKDEICAAVINERNIEVNSILTEFNLLNTVTERLIAIIDYYSVRAEQVSQYGNIFSGLAQELSRQQNPLAIKAREILTTLSNWLTTQFKSVYANDAEKQATKFLSTLQGMQVLTLAFQDPSITATQADLLKAEVAALTIREVA